MLHRALQTVILLLLILTTRAHTAMLSPVLGDIQDSTLVIVANLAIDDRGDLQAGLLADITAVQGNPLDDISSLRRVVFVMKGGQVYRAPSATSTR